MSLMLHNDLAGRDRLWLAMVLGKAAHLVAREFAPAPLSGEPRHRRPTLEDSGNVPDHSHLPPPSADRPRSDRGATFPGRGGTRA